MATFSTSKLTIQTYKDIQGFGSQNLGDAGMLRFWVLTQGSTCVSSCFLPPATSWQVTELHCNLDANVMPTPARTQKPDDFLGETWHPFFLETGRIHGLKTVAPHCNTWGWLFPTSCCCWDILCSFSAWDLILQFAEDILLEVSTTYAVLIWVKLFVGATHAEI